MGWSRTCRRNFTVGKQATITWRYNTMTNEEFWKLIDMQQQHEKELENISEIFIYHGQSCVTVEKSENGVISGLTVIAVHPTGKPLEGDIE